MAVDPCSVCGSKDLNLIDGFYYCVECGTQDTNVRETVIEQQFYADGTFAQSHKKKIKIKDQGVEMTGEWYKWHTFNFILNGLADEVIALGAEPSFKTKLLWIWTKYVKKYQIKEDMGLSQMNETESSIIRLAEDTKAEARDEDGNKKEVSVTKKKKGKWSNDMDDIKYISSALLLSMVYIALNLDKSDIQISHISRFINERRLIINNYDRHIPTGINAKSIPLWSKFKMSCGITRKVNIIMRCRMLAIRLCKELDLGPPIVPDMRKIIDNFTTELCLPSEFKNLVFSLMHLWPCDFLDVENRALRSLVKVPDYEGNAIAYILIGLKMCFGLDDDYEYRLSDVVDKFNDFEKFSKCYKIGFTPEPTGRLFSFREWIYYLQYRRKMLSKHRLLHTKEEHYGDVDDYIYMEYLKERPKGTMTMTEELSMDIVNKLNLNKEIDVIPKEYFPCTLTPLTTYTEILSQNLRHIQDVELLSEDFTQYSLKYACENLNLTTLQNDNLIIGINDQGKTVTDDEILCTYLKGIKTKWSKSPDMIYVRNCQNKNWLKTNKPTMEHVIVDSNDKINDEHDDDSDCGYDSNLPSTPSDKDGYVEGECEENDRALETITEEDEHKNIFDDTFEIIDKQEESMTQDNHYTENVENIELPDNNFQQSDDEDRESITSTESFKFNPDTFNREAVIKELILNACKKYKIPIPKEYRSTNVIKRKREYVDDVGEPQRKHARRSTRGELKQKVHKLLEAYYRHLEKDFLTHTSRELNLLIHNMTKTEQEDVFPDGDEDHNNSEPNNFSIHGYTNVSEISAIAPEHTQVNISKIEHDQENAESTLFNDENDGDNLEDFTIRNDPKYDAAKYDVDQLYIKIDDEEPEDIYEAMQDPEIDKIIEKKIEECNRTVITVKAKGRPRASSDSEDEIPLSLLRQEKEAYSKEANTNLGPLISNDIPEFKYWVKCYNTAYMAKGANILEKFESDITETMPKTFSFLLGECVIISGCSQFIIYKCLQNLERNLICCARQRT